MAKGTLEEFDRWKKNDVLEIRVKKESVLLHATDERRTVDAKRKRLPTS